MCMNFVLRSIGILRHFQFSLEICGLFCMCTTQTGEKSVRKRVASSDGFRGTRKLLTVCVCVSVRIMIQLWAEAWFLFLKMSDSWNTGHCVISICKALLRSYQCSFDTVRTSFGGFSTSVQTSLCLHVLLCSAHTMPHCLVHFGSTLPYCFNEICSDDSQRLSLCNRSISWT